MVLHEALFPPFFAGRPIIYQPRQKDGTFTLMPRIKSKGVETLEQTQVHFNKSAHAEHSKLTKNSCSNSLLVMQSAWFGLVHISLRGIVQGKEAASLLGGPSHPLLSEDGLEYPGENELDLAPDGRFLVEVLRSVDVAGGAGLWLRGEETGEVRWVTVEKW